MLERADAMSLKTDVGPVVWWEEDEEEEDDEKEALDAVLTNSLLVGEGLRQKLNSSSDKPDIICEMGVLWKVGHRDLDQLVSLFDL